MTLSVMEISTHPRVSMPGWRRRGDCPGRAALAPRGGCSSRGERSFLCSWACGEGEAQSVLGVGLRCGYLNWLMYKFCKWRVVPPLAGPASRWVPRYAAAWLVAALLSARSEAPWPVLLRCETEAIRGNTPCRGGKAADGRDTHQQGEVELKLPFNVCWDINWELRTSTI